MSGSLRLIEAQFSLREITAHSTKYYYVVSGLDRDTATQLLDLIKHPLSKDNHTPGMLFEQLFLERLPEDICIQTIDSKIEDHRQLARKVDALWSSREMDHDAAYAFQHKPYVQKQTKFRPSEQARDVSRTGATIIACSMMQSISVDSHITGRENDKAKHHRLCRLSVQLASLSSLILFPKVNFLLIRVQKLASYLQPVETQALGNKNNRCWQLTVTRYGRMAFVNSLSTSIPSPTSGTSQWQM